MQTREATAKGEDLGTKFAAHWTAAENANRPLAIADIEAARAVRRKNYATIAKEYVFICFSVSSDTLPLTFTLKTPSSLHPFGIHSSALRTYADFVLSSSSYYNLATDNLEMGWGPSFHFCPFPDPTESIDAAMTRHQHFIAYIMGLKPGMKGLDAGCGTGGPSREIARFAGVNVTGLTINALHVQ